MANVTRVLAGVLILLAVLLGILAWSLSRRPAGVPHSAASTAQARWPVVVATRELPPGKPIPADALAVRDMPINPAGTFSQPAVLAGRVPLAPLAASAPVFEAQLASGLTERIQPGERAVAVRVDETNAVGNQVLPGNFVDVFFTLKREGGGATGAEIERTQARLLMSRVRVLAFGNQSSAARGTRNSYAGGEGSASPRTAVLAVPVADVDKLALAEGSGRLVLALRNPADDEVADSSAFAPYAGVLKTVSNDKAPLQGSTEAAAGVALDELSGANGKSAAAPVRRALALRTAARRNSGGSIEVIRGGRAETLAW